MYSNEVTNGSGARSPGRLIGLWRDVCFGISAVLVAGLAIGIYSLGNTGVPIRWMGCLAAMTTGAGISLVGAGLAGRRPRLWDLLFDACAMGCLAAAASPDPLWKAPTGWGDLVHLSAFGAALCAVLYHTANLISLTSRRRPVGLVVRGELLLVPFVFGALLGLQPGAFADCAAGGGWLAQTALRMGLLLLFTEWVANVFCLGLRRMLLPGWKAHLCLLACSAGAVLSPVLADVGSGAGAGVSPAVPPFLVMIGATALSQGLLWAEVFLLTGVMLDALSGAGPSWRSLVRHAVRGLTKGAMFSGVLMALVLAVQSLAGTGAFRDAFAAHPVVFLTVAGALGFPLVRTILESFDESRSFIRRLALSVRDPVIYARGAVAGCGVALALGHHLTGLPIADRVWMGFIVGAAAYGGVSILRDGVYAGRGLGRIQSWRLYAVEGVFGGCLGAALFFYMDAAQMEVIRQRLAAYGQFGAVPARFDIYPILSKWGYVLLGTQSGGPKLLFNQAVMGAICWAIAAWLFAVNRAFLLALFQRQWAPVRNLGTRGGFAGLLKNTIQVMRWGLWMSPIIATFLWQMPTPTWFNQDGAIRTLVAIANSFSLTTGEFVRWSRELFLWVVAYGGFRIVIWLDHMGLRVATLVNLSFIGLDRLDERVARFIGPAATVRFLPEGVKRFATWAPLLIPYYIPAGADWDYVWNTSQAIMAGSRGWVEALVALPAGRQVVLMTGCVGVATAVAAGCRRVAACVACGREPAYTLSGPRYEVCAKAGGEVVSRLPQCDVDVTRRSYEGIDPAGRALFIVDAAVPQGQAGRWWPAVGNWPASLFSKGMVSQEEDALRITSAGNGIRTTVRITLAPEVPAAELWEIELCNDGPTARTLKVVPYLEWVLNSPVADRSHTQYNRLFPEVEYVAGLHAVLARHRDTKKVGFLAADITPDGFLMTRVDFIGRASSLWAPRALQTLRFHAPRDTGAGPDFDPTGCLLLGVTIPPGERRVVKLLIGCANSRPQACSWIRRALVSASRLPRAHVAPLRVFHGRRVPGIQPPYVEMRDAGRTMRVMTPFTPLPYDHTMANACGHILCVTNRGLHCSASENAQQNRLTAEWADTVTREIPAEAFYLFEATENVWYSPTYEPVRDEAARFLADFSLDGTATFRMEKGTLVTELTVFVPPDAPVGVYLLTLHNRASRPRRLRLAPYFQMALADEPENAGTLRVRRSGESGALFFSNPRNPFRSGPAFVAMSVPAETAITQRSCFFGRGNAVARPQAVAEGHASEADPVDRAAVAAFLTMIDLPPGGSQSVVVILGQADDRAGAEALIRRFAHVEAAQSALEETRRWWNGYAGALRVETNQAAFDAYLPWLQYQTLAERLLARKGFYQSSGAFGFRDQLQDAVNLIWVDPARARRQVLLHAAQQFVEGDVAHWFFLQHDGRTGLLNRSHASDNLLWLVWGVEEYVRMTGDLGLLQEKTSYLRAQTPLSPLPAGKHGWVGFAHRTPRVETLYRHCMRALDWVLDHRMGRNGLPLMGTGDWNDGLDAIGRKGRGESVWLGLFLYRVLGDFLPFIEAHTGQRRAGVYRRRQVALGRAIEAMWRGDRYVRAIADNGTEIGVAGGGSWEIDALMGAWPVLSGINPERAKVAFDTALRLLEKERVILLGWPALQEYGTPFLGRGSRYPEGVRESGMYCHGVQWLVRAARIISERAQADGDVVTAARYRDTSLRLWLKISPLSHVTPLEIENYGGQPNKQAADILAGPYPGRMIWNGYTGAAGWMLRQACEGVLGFALEGGALIPPTDLKEPRGDLVCRRVVRAASEGGARGAWPF